MSIEKTHPPAPKALGGFSAELCALIADHAACHPRLAPLFLPFWAILRRLCDRLDALLAAFRAGTLTLPEPRPASPRAPSAQAPHRAHPHALRARSSFLRPESVPDSAPAEPPRARFAPAVASRTAGVAPPRAHPHAAQARPKPPVPFFSAFLPALPSHVLFVTLS